MIDNQICVRRRLNRVYEKRSEKLLLRPLKSRLLLFAAFSRQGAARATAGARALALFLIQNHNCDDYGYYRNENSSYYYRSEIFHNEIPHNVNYYCLLDSFCILLSSDTVFTSCPGLTII